MEGWKYFEEILQNGGNDWIALPEIDFLHLSKLLHESQRKPWTQNLVG